MWLNQPMYSATAVEGHPLEALLNRSPRYPPNPEGRGALRLRASLQPWSAVSQDCCFDARPRAAGGWPRCRPLWCPASRGLRRSPLIVT
jgi:hypothetical protein